MDPLTIGWIGLSCFLLLLVIGVPVGASMGLVGFAGFALIVSPVAAFGKLAIVPMQIMSDFNFAVVPAFVLMAQIFNVAGFGNKLFDAGEKWLGHHRGGLGLATIVACAVFAAISSSSIATVVTIGMVAIPQMLKRNYLPSFAGATVAAAGGLGVLIPPSAVLILYGLMTEQSIKDLFMAGVIPGIVLAATYLGVVTIHCRINPDLAPAGPRYAFKEKLISLLACWEVFLIIIISIGGLFAGLYTPTEAGAAGATATIIVALLRKKLTWEGFVQALKGTMANTGLVGFILVGAILFNYFAAVTEIPKVLVELVGGIQAAPFVIMLVLTGFYLILGCFLDSLSMIMLTVPFIYPLVISLGYDPIWFGIYIVLVMEMAVITPPVGMNVYAVSGMFKSMPVETVFRGVLPFVIAQLANVLLILAVPQLVLFLPNLLK